MDEQGRFFVNAMHPDEDNYKATIGVINGVDWNNLPDVVVNSVQVKPTRMTFGMAFVLAMVIIRFSYKTGDALSDGRLAGGIYSANDGQQILLSQKPDFNAFIPTNQDGTNGFLYTAWEDRPAGISQVEIHWNLTSNQWDVLSSQMLNLSSINGGWVLCFGTVSPWGSQFLFSEELYFDDTSRRLEQSKLFLPWNQQLRLETYLGNYPNPYDYGFIIDTSNPELTRHYTMGRYSHENAQVMPDNKTVLSDDGYDTVLYKFGRYCR